MRDRKTGDGTAGIEKRPRELRDAIDRPLKLVVEIKSICQFLIMLPLTDVDFRHHLLPIF